MLHSRAHSEFFLHVYETVMGLAQPDLIPVFCVYNILLFSQWEKQMLSCCVNLEQGHILQHSTLFHFSAVQFPLWLVVNKCE